MKKLIIFSVLSALLAVSCNKDESAFDSTSQERIEKIWSETEEILCAPINGWSMEYFYDGSLSYGGSQLFLKFNDGSVEVTSEFEDSDYSATSLYTYAHDVSATINFDTYNPVFHYFTEPTESNPAGFGGDFEFTIMEYSAQQVILRGKRNYVYYVLTPLPENRTWEDLMDGYQELVEDMERLRKYTFYVDGNIYETERVKEGMKKLRRLTYTPLDEEGMEGEPVDLPFIYTLTGIKFYEPVTFGDVTFQEMIWTGMGFTDIESGATLE